MDQPLNINPPEPVEGIDYVIEEEEANGPSCPICQSAQEIDHKSELFCKHCIAELYDRYAVQDANLNMRINSTLLNDLKVIAKRQGIKEYQKFIQDILLEAVRQQRCRRMLTHKGYIGIMSIDDETGIVYGEVSNSRDVITFQGDTVAEAQKAFVDSVRDYLDLCAERGEEPDKPYSGKILLRLTPEEHRDISQAAVQAGVSLTEYVRKRLIDG